MNISYQSFTVHCSYWPTCWTEKWPYYLLILLMMRYMSIHVHVLEWIVSWTRPSFLFCEDLVHEKWVHVITHTHTHTYVCASSIILWELIFVSACLMCDCKSVNEYVKRLMWGDCLCEYVQLYIYIKELM